jgi:uncharacterized protein (DUF58 family)
VKTQMNEMERIYARLAEVEYFIKWHTRNLGFGKWNSTNSGEGYEFERLSEYSIHDNPKHINWRATAKSGGQRVYKNEYTSERNISIFLVVDRSDSMRFGTSESKSMLAAEVSAILSYSALRFNDEVGLITWPDVAFLPPRSTSNFYHIIVESLLEDRGPETKTLEAVLDLLPKNRCMVILISDFLSVENLYHTLREHTGRHDFIALLIEDRMEIELPRVFCFMKLRDLETGVFKKVAMSKQTIERFRQSTSAQRKEVFGVFDALGVHSLRVKADFSVQDFVNFFLNKRLWI